MEIRQEVPDVTEDYGRVEIVDTAFELAGLVEDSSYSEPAIGMVFAPAAQTPTITTVAFDGIDPTASAWEATQGGVRLEAIMNWLNTPGEFEGELIEALTQGEDEGVQALAASALAECSPTSAVVDDALRYACSGDSSLVAVTALESLVLRGTLTQNGIAQLLSLVRSPDAEIRSQAAGSLRHLAGSEWSSNCVAGLCELLSDTDQQTVAMAASTLGDFGAEAAGCRDYLLQTLNTTTSELTREAVQHALTRIPAELGSAALPQHSSVIQTAGSVSLLPIVE